MERESHAITGFNTVSLDYIRLLQAITVTGDEENLRLAYYKDAISVIENVVYAHDAERKWIQNHPIVLYECYILNHIFQQLNDNLNIEDGKLFSYESLTPKGHTLKNGVKVSLLCDDDIVYLMKNVYRGELTEEYFWRSSRRHPVWKSEAEYEAFFSQSIGGNNDSMTAFEKAMTATASYLTGTSDTWRIDDQTIAKLKDDFAKVAKPLQSNCPGRNKFYYLFYRRKDEMEEFDKAELCKYLANEFATLSTQRRTRTKNI